MCECVCVCVCVCVCALVRVRQKRNSSHVTKFHIALPHTTAAYSFIVFPDLSKLLSVRKQKLLSWISLNEYVVSFHIFTSTSFIIMHFPKSWRTGNKMLLCCDKPKKKWKIMYLVLLHTMCIRDFRLKPIIYAIFLAALKNTTCFKSGQSKNYNINSFTNANSKS